MSSTDARIIRLPEVMRRTGLSRSIVYQKMREGKFPKPAKLSKRINGWDAAKVDAWIDETLQQSAN